VFRCLVREHRERSAKRKSLQETSIIPTESKVTSTNEPSGSTQSGALGESDDAKEQPDLRSRRHDAHAVVKHVTATLLEVRPGFDASPKLTEMSATAVENLVFGELYRSVFDEIEEETREVDERLIYKIMEFDKLHQEPNWEDISSDALQALAMIPQAHSAGEKLRCAVMFLQHISEHVSSPDNYHTSDADSLLKMVCQHLVFAKVPHINAEISFIEEFARDEQLLRGKEGYALVTLQASLHFLNASKDLDKEMFLMDHSQATGVDTSSSETAAMSSQ